LRPSSCRLRAAESMAYVLPMPRRRAEIYPQLAAPRLGLLLLKLGQQRIGIIGIRPIAIGCCHVRLSI
jgi:hypothetical protein